MCSQCCSKVFLHATCWEKTSPETCLCSSLYNDNPSGQKVGCPASLLGPRENMAGVKGPETIILKMTAHLVPIQPQRTLPGYFLTVADVSV